MSKKIKILILSSALFIALAPRFVLAAVPPEQNPLCWTEKECRQAITKGGTVSWQNNFIKDNATEEQCGSENGFCIPAGQVQAQITIGEKKIFSGLGDYFPTVYRYLVSIAGIVAAVLIIYGGFKYITSAGDSTKVTAAKESIGSALIGLLLVLGSYVVLQTVNPELVNLKLPSVYMIKTIKQLTWCDELIEDGKTIGTDNEIKVALFAGGEQTKPASQTLCGITYHNSVTANKVCRGRFCGTCTDKNCVKQEGFACAIGTDGRVDSCTNTILSGQITGDREKPVDDDLVLIELCREKDGNIYSRFHGSTQAYDIDNKKQGYNFVSQSKSVTQTKCSSDDRALGVYLEAEINDPNGNDDWVSIDRNGNNLLAELDNNWAKNCSSGKLRDCKEFLKKIDQVQLFSVESLATAGQNLDLNIFVGQFPNR